MGESSNFGLHHYIIATMEVEEIRSLCLGMPGVTEDMKWGEHLCFSVGSKLFIVLGMDEMPVTASFKIADEDFEELTAQPSFTQAPHFAKRKWVRANDIAHLTPERIRQAYHIISQKLTKKLQRELGLL